MGFKQFLLCRALWHEHTEHRPLFTKLQIKDSLKNTGKMLEELGPSAVETTPGDLLGVEEDDESTPPEEHKQTPFNPDTPIPPELVSVLFPPTIDEQIVNSALVTFLDALTLHFGISSSWTLHRIPFTAIFKIAQFEARTDGYLRDRSGKPSIIIEVKPIIRMHNLMPIQIQETAQMVAWIKSDDTEAQKRRTTRILIAQDRNQIFVMVAEYGQEYLDYLNDRPSSSPLRPRPAFLTMHQYGPWNTQRPEHMRQLGPLLLAITMRADAEG